MPPSKLQRTFRSFECLVTLVSGPSTALNLVILYRPPPSPINCLTHSDFQEEFSDFITTLNSSLSRVLIIGDFNVHWESTSCSYATYLCDQLLSSNFTQHVSGPTHTDGHTIDLVISLVNDNLIDTVQVSDQISDHNIIHCHLHLCSCSGCFIF